MRFGRLRGLCRSGATVRTATARGSVALRASTETQSDKAGLRGEGALMVIRAERRLGSHRARRQEGDREGKAATGPAAAIGRLAGREGCATNRRRTGRERRGREQRAAAAAAAAAALLRTAAALQQRRRGGSFCQRVCLRRSRWPPPPTSQRPATQPRPPVAAWTRPVLRRLEALHLRPVSCRARRRASRPQAKQPHRLAARHRIYRHRYVADRESGDRRVGGQPSPVDKTER